MIEGDFPCSMLSPLIEKSMAQRTLSGVLPLAQSATGFRLSVFLQITSYNDILFRAVCILCEFEQFFVNVSFH